MNDDKTLGIQYDPTLLFMLFQFNCNGLAEPLLELFKAAFDGDFSIEGIFTGRPFIIVQIKMKDLPNVNRYMKLLFKLNVGQSHQVQSKNAASLVPLMDVQLLHEAIAYS